MSESKVNVKIVKSNSTRGILDTFLIQKASAGGKSIGPSGQMADPFEGLYETQGFLPPPYDPLSLLKMAEQNNILQPLIDAYKTNITGFGWGLKYTIDMNSELIGPEIKDRAQKEWILLENFYKNCNFTQSFTSITKKMIGDREGCGYGTLEVIPKGNGFPGALKYIPAHTIRLTKYHPDVQTITISTVGVDGKKLNITYQERFRKFIQYVPGNNPEMIWFKEFGDPRRMDKYTGRFEVELDPQGNEVRTDIPPENEATSILFFPIHCAYSPYGVPRWMGNFIGATGSRKSEELNYNYFQRGKHIPMAILVKNGVLTETSIEKLEEYSNLVSGVENAHSYLILEAEGFDEEDGGSSSSQVDIKLQPLTQVIQHDALFQTYDENCRNKLRAAFRLPPIYTGESKDYTRATADTARSIAEEQIFNPEREELASIFNRLINAAMDIRYVEMYFKGPNLSNKLEQAQAVRIYAQAGALTPNMLIRAVSDLLGEEFEPITEEWGNLPIQLTLAKLSSGADSSQRATPVGATPTSEGGGRATPKSNKSSSVFTDQTAENKIKGE